MQRVGDSDGIGLTLGIRDSLVEEHSPFCRAGLTCSNSPATLATRGSLMEDNLCEVLDHRDRGIWLINLHLSGIFGTLHETCHGRIRELCVRPCRVHSDTTEAEREVLLTVKGRHRLCCGCLVVTLTVNGRPVGKVGRIELFLLPMVFLCDSDTTEIGTASADDLDITGLSFCSRCSVRRSHLRGSDATDSVIGIGSTVARQRHLVLGVLDGDLDDSATVELSVAVSAGLQFALGSIDGERDAIDIGGHCSCRALKRHRRDCGWDTVLEIPLSCEILCPHRLRQQEDAQQPKE